jgi:hypothetical protein
LKFLPSEILALCSANAQDGKRPPNIQLLTKWLRQTWLRRALVVLVLLLLLLGSSFTLLEACPVSHPASEAVCQEFYMDEYDQMPVVLTIPEGPADALQSDCPAWPPDQAPREQAHEPEHAPPRIG